MKITQTILIISLIIVIVIFGSIALLSYQKFRGELVDRQLLDHQKLNQIITQSLNQYFHLVRQVTEFIALNKAYNSETAVNEDRLRYLAIEKIKAENLSKALDITEILPNSQPQSSKNEMDYVYNWQLYKGLPDKDGNGNEIATERRKIARRVRQVFPDLEFVFEMDANGDMVFVEPFADQINLKKFNYSFRDYLMGTKNTKGTILTEAYISLDIQHRQAISVATPIFDRSGKVAKIIAASVSNTTLRNTVFQPLKNLVSRDNTLFYFIDRHGHVVASSSDQGDYLPNRNVDSDEKDDGNFRAYGPLEELQWENDIFESGTEWQRSTKSWDVSTLKNYYTKEYYNQSGIHVFGTFYPIPLLDKRSPRYGILIETPITTIQDNQNQLNILFLTAGLFLLTILLILARAIMLGYFSITKELKNKEKHLENVFSKVSKDLQVPLISLEMLLPNFEEQPENIRSRYSKTINKIRKIVSGLL